MSAGILIESNLVSSGNSYDGIYTFNNDISGRFKVLYSWVEDGNIPICYDGINNLHVIRDSNGASVVAYFSDLSSDAKTDVETFADSIAAALATIGVTFTRVVDADNNITYTFNTSVTLDLANSSSRFIFGSSNMTGTVLTLSGQHLNARPKFLAFNIAQAQQMYNAKFSTPFHIVISTYDDMIKDLLVYIPNSTSQLNIQVCRLHAPHVPCPITIPFAVLLQFETTF